MLGAEVIIPEEMERGCKICAGGKTAKNVSGYDMAKVYIGSLGTLAILASVTCKIYPLPEDRATVVGTFAKPEAPWTLAQVLLDSQLVPACINIYNRETASMLPADLAQSDKASAWVAVGVEGVKEAVERHVNDIGKMMRDQRATDVSVISESTEADYWKAMGQIGSAVRTNNEFSIGIEASVPISGAQEISTLIEKKGDKIGVPCCQLSYAGSGIVYSHIPLDQSGYQKYEQKLAEMVTAVRERVGGVPVGGREG